MAHIESFQLFLCFGLILLVGTPGFLLLSPDRNFIWKDMKKWYPKSIVLASVPLAVSFYDPLLSAVVELMVMGILLAWFIRANTSQNRL